MQAIVLSGGTSRRFGSDKSRALVNGKTLLEILIANLYKVDINQVVVVGPKVGLPGVEFIREVPEFGGPVAAITAGLTKIESEKVAIFATDMPFAPLLIPELLENLLHDAALPVDNQGFIQPLAAIYLRARLKAALESFESVDDRSMRELISKLQVEKVEIAPDRMDFLLDIDTQDALQSAIDLASRLS